MKTIKTCITNPELVKVGQNCEVKVEHQTPHTFTDGYVKVGIYWDNELINEDIQKIYQSFF